MDIFDCLTMVGGLCLFLFGMNIMGEALERRAGASLRALLGKLTTNRMLGFLTGLAVTAVIQSSSATTVMVVGFVNSGLLTLGQAINVIMGANVGTTVTAWILSLGGIESSNVLVQLLKPSSFTPILAVWGIVYYMFLKDSRKKDTGMIFLGFATLMFGMETMSDAVSGLKDVPAFQQLFLLFTNPILGVLAGAVLTAIIQSSSASVGTTKNAKRAAVVHLMFNILGTMICLTLFTAVQTLLAPAILGEQATYLGIAICHTMFNVICTAILLPSGDLLEKLVCRLVPDNEKPEVVAELDERLLTTPSIALERCQSLTFEMADVAAQAIHDGVALVREFNPALAKQIREEENRTDHYEDILGTYLVKLSALKISDADSSEATMLLKSLNDFERIGDHALNLVESAEELQKKHLDFSDTAKHELAVLTRAVDEIVALSFSAFRENNLEKAYQVEPLEQVIDDLKEKLRVHHILRMQQGSCSIESGFVWSDLLTALERVGDHCSNIAGCVVDMAHHDMNTHESLRSARIENENFGEQYKAFAAKYSLK